MFDTLLSVSVYSNKIRLKKLGRDMLKQIDS
jgi:hypothetical protein